MKRIIACILAGCLMLLVGCAQSQDVTEPSSKTVPSAIHIAYMPNSSVEQETEGAVRFYAVSENVDKLDMMSTGLVMIDDVGQMSVYSEESDSIIASYSGEASVLYAQKDNSVVYEPTSRTVTLLNNMLIKTASHNLEEGVYGDLVAGHTEVFYCVGDHIRALDLQSGLSRNVMQYVPEEQFLAGCYFDGEVIGWNDGAKTIYLSSKDGQVIFQDENLTAFYAAADNYYGVYQDGDITQHIWGETDSAPVQFTFTEEQLVYPQMNFGCIVSANAQEFGYTVNRFDMTSGKHVASVTAKFSGEILDVTASEKYVWILTTEGLYKWDFAMSALEEPVECVTTMISAQNPDLEALEKCNERAKAIGEKYGVDIHIWEDALLNDESYVIVGEYQEEAITKMLDGVEKQLENIPTNLLQSTDEYCGIQICLVRSIQDHQFIQFRIDRGLCIAITPECNISEAILTGLGWGIDSRIIGNSRDLDYWDDMNPYGFEYDYSYFVNEHRTDLEYLEGDNRAFVDKRSMSFPSEDRARIFYYAMTDGNEEIFASVTLQAKLKTFCEGIREAYGWQKETVIFQWEQYLEESIAFVK